MTSSQTAPVALPRVAITYCTQCRWMLRAAYFGQELLSTFGNQIGEIALIPATGGLFTVELTYKPIEATDGQDIQPQKVLLWDRKARSGFPETKVLKQLVRDHIDPARDLGHSDKHGKKKEEKEQVTGEDTLDVKESTGDGVEIKRKEEEEQTASEGTPGVKESADDGVEIKRNSDGTVCEDCR